MCIRTEKCSGLCKKSLSFLVMQIQLWYLGPLLFSQQHFLTKWMIHSTLPKPYIHLSRANKDLIYIKIWISYLLARNSRSILFCFDFFLALPTSYILSDRLSSCHVQVAHTSFLVIFKQTLAFISVPAVGQVKINKLII